MAPLSLLTQFALKGRSGLHLSEDWLSIRLDLFRQWCVPGVLAQTDSNFDWFIGVDSAVPKEFREEISRSVSGVAEIITVDGDEGQRFSEMVPRAKKQISARLDSDDFIGPEYISLIRQFSKPGEALNFFSGARVALPDGRVSAIWDAAGPFTSYFTEEGKTVLEMGRHREISRKVRVNNLVTRFPIWLQTVSGTNISNRVKRYYPNLSDHKLAHFGEALPKYRFVGEASNSQRFAGLLRSPVGGIIWAGQRLRAKKIGETIIVGH